MDRTDIVIRSLSSDDWDEICTLYKSAALLELAEAGMDRSQFTPMQKEVKRATFFRINAGYVACDGTRIAGFVAWRDRGEWQGSGYLSWLYVTPRYHRQGIGTRLLNEAWPYLGAQAWTLAKPGNAPAIALYKKFGMQIVCGDASNVRLALPSSTKYDPDVPNFGV